MAQPKKRSDTVIVHELLAFLQNQLNIIDEASLEQICLLHYTDDDISEAKNVLQRSAKTSVFLPTRKTKSKNLQDMFKVFKETNPKDVPTFVARNLHLLPSVAMDHDIISMLLKDIMQLRTELKSAQRKPSNAEQSVDRQSGVTSSCTESVESVQSLVSSIPETSYCTTSSDAATNQGRDIASTSRPLSPDSNSFSSNTPSETYATPQPSRPESSLAEENKANTSTFHQPSARVIDEDGFTLVENRKNRNSQSGTNSKQKGLDREQLVLQKEFQITGVLENSDENVMDITRLIISSIGLLVNKRDIVDARRVGPLRMGKEADQRPRPIVVRVSRRSLQEEVIRYARAYGDSILSVGYYDLRGSNPIHIRERLTKENRQLLHKARLLCKENNWKYAWSRDGMIFVKEGEGKTTFQVHNESDLKIIF